MKVTKNSRQATKRIKKRVMREKRSIVKKAKVLHNKHMQSVKMRLSLSNKDGHVSSIREYLGTIEQDINHFSNCTQPAVDLMSIICNESALVPWIAENKELVLLMQDQIEAVEHITSNLRRIRDDAAAMLAKFQETEFEDREAMIQFAFGIILSIASSVDTAREQYEEIGSSLMDNVFAVKPQLLQYIKE